MNRMSIWMTLSLAFALAVVLASPVLATEKIKSTSPRQSQFTVTDKDGKEWTYHLTEHARIFLPNGKEGKLSDLKAGDSVSVLWEKNGDRYMTKAILQQEGDAKNSALAEGKIKRVNAGQHEFVMADSKHKDWTYEASDSAKVQIGRKSGKLSDLKEGEMAIIVYEKKGNKYIVHDVFAEQK